MSQADQIKELIERIQQGDREARRDLMALLSDERQFGLALLVIARRVLPADHNARRIVDSRDVIQSALRTAFRNLSHFRGSTEKSLLAWLRAIMRSKVSRARRHIHSQSSQEPDLGTSEDPLEKILDQDLVSSLHRAILGLPLDQRLVTELRLRGLNATQIGTILHLKPATVRKREERSVARLKTLLQES